MSATRRRYLIAGLCVLAFIAAQAFQSLAYWLWIPAPNAPQDDLLACLLPVDQVRQWLVMITILFLIVPYAVIALRYRRAAPLASLLGLIFATGFIGFELSARSIDLFLISQWAHQYRASADALLSSTILHHFSLWNDFMYAWTFPLRLTAFLASCFFAAAAAHDRPAWARLAQVAFLLNALRLLARLLGTYAHQAWLGPFNNTWYFPSQLVINSLLLFWFFQVARSESAVDTRDSRGPGEIRTPNQGIMSPPTTP